jgi:hypothetical protein
LKQQRLPIFACENQCSVDRFAIYFLWAAFEHSRMHNSDYYREEAAKYRELAAMAKDEATKQELLELATACEGIADNIDDLRASG